MQRVTSGVHGEQEDSDAKNDGTDDDCVELRGIHTKCSIKLQAHRSLRIEVTGYQRHTRSGWNQEREIVHYRIFWPGEDDAVAHQHDRKQRT